MTNVLIWGIGGRMGRTLLECLNKNEYTTAVGGVDKFANQADFNIPIFQNISDITFTLWWHSISSISKFSPRRFVAFFTRSISKFIPMLFYP